MTLPAFTPIGITRDDISGFTPSPSSEFLNARWRPGFALGHTFEFLNLVPLLYWTPDKFITLMDAEISGEPLNVAGTSARLDDAVLAQLPSPRATSDLLLANLHPIRGNSVLNYAGQLWGYPIFDALSFSCVMQQRASLTGEICEDGIYAREGYWHTSIPRSPGQDWYYDYGMRPIWNHWEGDWESACSLLSLSYHYTQVPLIRTGTTNMFPKSTQPRVSNQREWPAVWLHATRTADSVYIFCASTLGTTSIYLELLNPSGVAPIRADPPLHPQHWRVQIPVAEAVSSPSFILQVQFEDSTSWAAVQATMMSYYGPISSVCPLMAWPQLEPE